MTRAVVALGANLGDREATLKTAAAALADAGTVRLSPMVETIALTPHGLDPDAPRYLNAVALVDTDLDARALFGLLQRIEVAHGRVRIERWAPRTLDLDLVAFGDTSIADPDLVVPHPAAASRVFVLQPWLALDPDAVLPGAGRVADLLAALPERVSPWPPAGALDLDTDPLGGSSAEPDGGTS